MKKESISYENMQAILKPIIAFYDAGGFMNLPPRVANAMDSINQMFGA